ncbi:hypothetical protein [Clostridium botulinum]|uniref:hypothetical protein n=1 Tax=Clostridium botulinum TaxID=1491 RepID=UPI0006932206|nr:hypothetical protein [Clostridium botulinum]
MKIINEGLKFNNLTYGNIPNKIVLHNADTSHCTVQDIHQWWLEWNRLSLLCKKRWFNLQR